MKSTRCLSSPELLAIAVLLAVSSAAKAQATRTWVSGVGDDANPASRTAPCKTFAGAISKTTANGEINVLDPGGYGAVTVTKGMTIDGGGTFASILSAGTTGVVVSAGTNDVITLRNLSINGSGTGIHGVRVLAAGMVRIENCTIFNTTTTGVDFSPSNPNATLYIKNCHIYQGGTGVFVRPTANGKVVIEQSVIEQCATGIDVSAGAVTLSEVTVAGNTGAGLSSSGTGSIRTFHNNRVFGNNPDGNFTSSLPLR